MTHSMCYKHRGRRNPYLPETASLCLFKLFFYITIQHSKIYFHLETTKLEYAYHSLRKMEFSNGLMRLATICLLISFIILSSIPSEHLMTVAHHHGGGGGGSGLETLLAAGILAKLLGKRHHHGHHQHIPIPIPVPVHHHGGGHEVMVHHGHHGHHHHGK
ncbi:hypothetical protein NPIL_79951 [Nephila pilipes]|uniref:Uncharacterized protein n=1 Tax=Nephila pilipes TaxID=299642 RepID=A0A8X6UB92_NEPPI|nr:hypothetical protein NPIL_79951 [Nephila pilipes]